MDRPVWLDVLMFSLMTTGTLTLIYIMYRNEYEEYRETKGRGEEVTWRQVFRLMLADLKSAVIELPRAVLLFAVMVLPLIASIASTLLSLSLIEGSIEASLLGTEWGPLPAGVGLIISLLFLVTDLAFIGYFFEKYGSIYKLAFLYIVKEGYVEQLFSRHQYMRKPLDSIIVILTMGSLIYVVIIMTFLGCIIKLPSIISKVNSYIVLVFLLGYVLPNKEYVNAVDLIGKIWRIGNSRAK